MKKIVVIAAHPDDEVLGCGGVMAMHAKQGDHVHVAVVTRGMPELFDPVAVQAIRDELANAHQLLGVKSVKFLDFPAPALDAVAGYLIADAIRKVLAEIAPDIIYFPHHGDIHGDHRAASLATMVAARPNGAILVPRMLAYETLSESEWGNPNGADAFLPTVFVDISGHLDAKLEAMKCYRSQLRDSPNARSLEAIRALAAYRGHTVNLPAAEAFMLVREILVQR